MWADWSPGWKWAPEDMEALKRCSRAPATLPAALGYYRATFAALLHRSAGSPAPAAANPAPINLPAMMLHGRDDGCIGVELLDGMEAFFPKGLRKEIVPGAGHFVHQEKPEIVNRFVLEFLKT